MVQKLKLNFSVADDYDRVSSFLNAELTKKADSHHYIAKRKEEYFRNTVNSNAAAFLTNDQNEIVYFTSTYHVYENGVADFTKQHDYTEVGTSISLIRGFGATPFVSSALVLKEYLFNPPKGCFYSCIKEHNKPAIVNRNQVLGWGFIEDASVLPRIDKAGLASLENVTVSHEGDERELYFMAGSDAWQKQANIVLHTIDRGGLMNKNGDLMLIDFSILDKMGLTLERLKSIVAGEIDREKILKL